VALLIRLVSMIEYNSDISNTNTLKMFDMNTCLYDFTTHRRKPGFFCASPEEVQIPHALL